MAFRLGLRCLLPVSARVTNRFQPVNRQTSLKTYLQSSNATPLTCLSRVAGRTLSCGRVTQNINHGLKHVSKRYFHTTERRNLNPIFLLLGKQGAKMISVLGGRTFRKWWAKLPPEQKAKYKAVLGSYRKWFAAAGCLVIGYGYYNYRSHIQEAPVTGRKRYIAFTPEQFASLAEHEYKQVWDSVKSEVLPPQHPYYKRIGKIVNNIVNANQDIAFFREQTWTLIVVDSEEANAFMLPSGHMIVYTGILKLAANDDQLAAVFGHEMSHALLQHGAEKISWAGILDNFLILVLAALWAFVPSDGIALITHKFMNAVTNIMLSLPYERDMEKEADQVGLLLAAKACYDVRESSNFWLLMQVANDGEQPPEWLSTHPNNSSRVDDLDQFVPKALEARTLCNCPHVSMNDPRTPVKAAFKEYMEEKRRNEEARRREAEERQKGQQQIIVQPTVVKPHKAGA